MSDPENFIARWSRRKREAAEGEATSAGRTPAAEAPRPTTPSRRAEGCRRRAAPPSGSERADALPSSISTSLPPIESITAESDIRAFLAPGVPPELTRAALRRAWAADPRIRDFVGLAENSWDFNDAGCDARASGRWK